MYLRTFIVALITACSGLQANEIHKTIEKKIDIIVSDRIAKDTPGCSIGLMKDQKLIVAKGYGMANLEQNTVLTSQSIHRLASVSKQFTAFSVLLLADEGKINLNDDIRTHLPDLYDYGTKVTINSMLGHASGMGDYNDLDKLLATPLKSVAGGKFRLGDEDYLTINEYYDVIKSLPLVQPPIQAQRYSNFAYFLLSMLVEKVSGESLREYSDRRIFKPLGMNNTFFADDLWEIVPNRASGYAHIGEGNYINRMTNIFAVGDGGLHTNIEDMALWDAHFNQPVLGRNPQKLMMLMNTPNTSLGYDEDETYKYANGQYTNGSTYDHSGGWLGTSTFYMRKPNEKISVAVFCNVGAFDSAIVGMEILDMAHEYLAD
jgi:CubicO group peptidase (beta-lactamase class C family)